MSLKIIINTANLQKGGALQVAASFIQEASKVRDIDFHVILGVASSKVVNPNEYATSKNIIFHYVNLVPTQSILNFFKFRKRMSKIEKKINPKGVITAFGPCYWKPQSPHIMGFANGYLLYEDTYFFTVWQGWKAWKYKLKKKIQQFLLKREARLYWTETEDSKKRLSAFIGIPLMYITVASNNCSNFFRETPYKLLDRLPTKKATRLLYISSYYSHKGFELIPPILDILIEKNIEVELLLTINSFDFERLFAGYPNVINLGQVNPRYCPYLYEVSDIVFIPTLLEVFSAVYPEAMYSKKPILTTDLPFARDICGDAALYFDPVSPKDATKKIQQLLNNADLGNRLIANGLARLKMFDLPEERFRKILNVLLKGLTR